MQDVRTLFQMIKQLNFILNKKQKYQMIFMFFVIFFGSLFELLSVTAMLPFIQAIMAPEELLNKKYVIILMDTFGIDTQQGMLVMIGILIVMIYLIKNICLSISSYLQALYSNNIQRELAVLMMNSYVNRPYSFFVDTSVGDIVRGVGGDIEGVCSVISNFFKFLSESLVLVSIAIYLFLIDSVLAGGIILIGIMCILVVILVLKKQISKMSGIFRDAQSNTNGSTYQILNGIKDIMVFKKKDFFVDIFDQSYRKRNIANTRYMFFCALPERVIEAFCISGIILMVLIRIKMGVDVATFVPQLSIFAMGAFRLLPSISRTIGYINNFVYNRPMVEAAYDNIRNARCHLEEVGKSIDKDKNLDDTVFSKEINIQNISFKYPEAKKRVLEKLNITINKGEAIGIIGASGSGKSTLGDILLSLYTPQEGHIFMDEINIKKIPDIWCKVISYVPQSVFLIDDTIRANVAFGEEKIDDDKVWNALAKASLDKFVKNLPDGLDTVVGERGVKFSGGQRQRIAIARALYFEPQVLILDEATSALDNETEEAVMEAIDALAGQITLIIIAHRVTTLRSCDNIYEIVDRKAVKRDKNEVLNG